MFLRKRGAVMSQENDNIFAQLMHETPDPQTATEEAEEAVEDADIPTKNELKKLKRSAEDLEERYKRAYAAKYMKSPDDLSLRFGIPKNKITKEMMTQVVNSNQELADLKALATEAKRLYEDREDLFRGLVDESEIDVLIDTSEGTVSLKSWLEKIDGAIAVARTDLNYANKQIDTLESREGRSFWVDVMQNATSTVIYLNGYILNLKKISTQLPAKSISYERLSERLDEAKALRDNGKMLIELAKTASWT